MKLEILDSVKGSGDGLVLKVDDAHIVYADFSGARYPFSDGKRRFFISIDDDDAITALTNAGYNINHKEDRTPSDTLKVNFSFKGRGPNIYLVTNGVYTKITEDNVADLDNLRFTHADMDLHGWDYEFAGKSGRTVYLNNLRLYQDVDRFAEEYYSQQAGDEECPF